LAALSLFDCESIFATAGGFGELPSAGDATETFQEI
jgi:hypothetical protein